MANSCLPGSRSVPIVPRDNDVADSGTARAQQRAVPSLGVAHFLLQLVHTYLLCCFLVIEIHYINKRFLL